MLTSLSNKAMVTKSRAMYGKRLTKEDYQELVRMKSVRDIAVFLKSSPGYSDQLANIYPESIHRGQLELLLEKSVFHKYIRLTRYDINNKGSFLSFVISRFEVEQILRCIMYLNAQISEDFITNLPGYLISHATFPVMKLASVRNFPELLTVLEKTKYYDTVRLFAPKEGERIDYTACETALQTLYYREIFDILEKTVKGKEKEELKDILKIQIELKNISTIYRLKTYFRMEPEEIRSHLLPFSYRLKKDRLENLLKAEDGETIIRYLQNSLYGKRLADDRLKYIEDYTKQINAYYSKQLMRFSVNVPAVVYGFMELMQLEVLNITNIIEGIRYHMSPDNIKKLLVIL